MSSSLKGRGTKRHTEKVPVCRFTLNVYKWQANVGKPEPRAAFDVGGTDASQLLDHLLPSRHTAAGMLNQNQRS